MLDVHHDQLEKFRKENYPLAELLDYCFTRNIPLSWNSIASALKSESIQEASLAFAISKKYCQEEENTKLCSKTQKGQQPSVLENSIIIHRYYPDEKEENIEPSSKRRKGWLLNLQRTFCLINLYHDAQWTLKKISRRFNKLLSLMHQLAIYN